MSKKLTLPRSTVGRGYVVVWNDGSLGWWMPEFVSKRVCYPPPTQGMKAVYATGSFNHRFYLCDIIIKPLKDSKGRPMTKMVRF